MGALFHRSKVTRRSQCSCFELESRRIHCCLLETFATVFLDSILAALDFTQDRLILPFLCHLFNKKTKPSTTSQCSEKRSVKERIQSDSNMIQWYHTSCLTHGTFFEIIWALEGSHSTSWSRSFCAVCRTWRHLITHVGRAFVCCFSCHTFFLHAFHFRYKKLCLLGRWRSSSPT